jgi:CxxC motif-containing protein (DUF1111 family)
MEKYFKIKSLFSIRLLLAVGCSISVGLWSCQKENPDPLGPAIEDDLPAGVDFTTYDRSDNAFGRQAKSLTFEEDGRFVAGNSLFQTNWVAAPASVQSLDGLGPLINASSCGGCHFKDGRAKPPEVLGAPLNGLLIRLSVRGLSSHGEPLGDPNYGGQLQDKAILDAHPEARVQLTYQEINGSYVDGTSYSLRKPTLKFAELAYGPFAPTLMTSPRIAQQLPGLGLLEAIPESAILALADELDQNSDGISGKPNYVWDVERNRLSLGRFGWKANMPNLRQQAAGAFNGDMGLTTSLFPLEELTTAQTSLAKLPNGGIPEISEEQLVKIVFYLSTLAVPARRNSSDIEVKQGAKLFASLKCNACHVQQFVTSENYSIKQARNVTIRPYTDLLLHDMGAGLADGRPDFAANGQEWRTPPLWGIGMVKVVNKHTFFLHDGRARNLEEAILWHGGEAQFSQEGFKKLSIKERADLIAFLESL